MSEDASAFLMSFPEPPDSLTASFGSCETAARALTNLEVVLVQKLRGQPNEGVVMMLTGDRREALTFAKQHKRFYTLITDPKGLEPAPPKPEEVAQKIARRIVAQIRAWEISDRADAAINAELDRLLGPRRRT